jgi:two-component system, sensor histidine kinase LadS
VARGLEPVLQLPRDVTLRFRVVTASAPGGAIELTGDPAFDEQRLMQRLNAVLDHVVAEERRVIYHLSPPASANTSQPPEPASA